MAGQVRVDTDLMHVTAQQSATKADNMIAQARTLSAGIEFVRDRWQGQAGEAFRIAMGNQQALLDQLIRKLQLISETIKQAGQGFDSQDASGRARLTAQGQSFLNGPLNHS
jgi:WXG100 family type VII secretion target